MPSIGFTKSNTVNETPTENKGFTKGDGFAPAPDNAVLEVEVLDMRYRKVNPEKTPWKKHKDEIAFTFKVIGKAIGPDGEELSGFKNRRFWADVPFYLDDSAGCQLRLWLQSLIGLPSLPEDFEFDTDELEEYIGFDARIRVNQWTVKNGPNAGDIRNGVVEVLPALVAPSYQDADEIF